jgi:hypothetical protein
MSAIEDMLLKFTSGNDVSVQRAVVTLDEWRATYAEYMALQARVAELDAKLSRLTAAGRALADDIVSRIPVDDEGFQPYDGDMAVWDELHAALSEAGK